MLARDYLNDTRPAVIHLFRGLDSYAHKAQPLLGEVNINGSLRAAAMGLASYDKETERLFNLEFVLATLAGSILQTAYMGLNLYSTNKLAPESCRSLGISEGDKLAKFCVGREVHGVPIGLLIYVGRVQYNHWDDEGGLKPIPEQVLTLISSAHANDSIYDLAYTRTFPERRPISHYILRNDIGWQTYKDYVRDMKNLLAIK